MKLASYRDGSRDGQLVVVSRDGVSAHYATGIATRLQQVLDDWNFLSPQLQDLYETLSHGKARHAFPFDPALTMAPLPRAYQWVEDGGATGDGAELQEIGSDELHGPRDDLVLEPAQAAEVEAAPALAVVTGDIAQGVAPEAALEGVRLVLLAHAVARTGAAPHRSYTACGPYAVTPDEFGDAWRGGRLQATLSVHLNGRPLCRIEAGERQRRAFGELIAQRARVRRVRAGSIVASGALHAADDDDAGHPAVLTPGDRIRIELQGRDGQAVLGDIEQRVAARRDGD